MDGEVENELNQLKEIIKKLENYVKVTGYEEYKRINQYTEELRYSSVNYLMKHSWLKEQLEFDFRMMLRARIKDDFIEFCRYANLQIELMIDEFIKALENENRIKVKKGNFNEINSIEFNDTRANSESNAKRYGGTNLEKLDFCLDFMDINDERTKEIIKNIMKFRNIASHRDASYTDIETRINNL